MKVLQLKLEVVVVRVLEMNVCSDFEVGLQVEWRRTGLTRDFSLLGDLHPTLSFE